MSNTKFIKIEICLAIIILPKSSFFRVPPVPSVFCPSVLLASVPSVPSTCDMQVDVFWVTQPPWQGVHWNRSLHCKRLRKTYDHHETTTSARNKKKRKGGPSLTQEPAFHPNTPRRVERLVESAG